MKITDKIMKYLKQKYILSNFTSAIQILKLKYFE